MGDLLKALARNPVVGGGVVLLGVWFIYGGRITQAVKNDAAAVGHAVNPTNPKNVFYSGVNSVGASLSGDPNWDLGGWIYDLTHPAYNPNAPAPPADPNAYDTQSITEANQ